MNYPTDLELRLAVIKTQPENWPNAFIFKGAISHNNWDEHPPEYERSLDAIMPLVRQTPLQAHNVMIALHHIFLKTEEFTRCSFEDWIGIYATPADYCHAYLAAKGEDNV